MTIYVNNIVVESFKFPGGEIQVYLKNNMLKPLNNGEFHTIEAFLYGSDDIMELLFVVDSLRRLTSNKIMLEIPYFPYARQDRISNYGESLSIEVMANIINQLNFYRVIVVDPHCDKLSSILNNSSSYGAADIWYSRFYSKESVKKRIVCPDKGAILRCKKVRDYAWKNDSSSFYDKIIYAEKVRNPVNGEILSIKLNSSIDDSDDLKNDLIIFDDICDGGRTFIELAKVLDKSSHYIKRKLELYVTHGIFSNGLDELKKYFDHIYCYHTFLRESEIDNEFLTIFSNHRRP